VPEGAKALWGSKLTVPVDDSGRDGVDYSARIQTVRREKLLYYDIMRHSIG
jgi:hypothetical protein